MFVRDKAITPRILFATFAFLAVPVTVFAQQKEAVCIGAVRDQDGGPLPGVKVSVVRLGTNDLPTNETVSRGTDSDGVFRIPIPVEWPPGTKIVIWAHANGKEPRQAVPLKLDSMKPPPQDVVLDCEIGQVQIGILVLKPENQKEELPRRQRVSAFSDATVWDRSQAFRRSIFDDTVRALAKYKEALAQYRPTPLTCEILSSLVFWVRRLPAVFP